MQARFRSERSRETDTHHGSCKQRRIYEGGLERERGIQKSVREKHARCVQEGANGEVIQAAAGAQGAASIKKMNRKEIKEEKASKRFLFVCIILFQLL